LKGGNDWHSYDFATHPGQMLYSWRVNELFGHSSIHLELATEGADLGFLALAPRDGRDDLVARTIERAEAGDVDPVVRAVLEFRDRNADRIQKRSACVLLANELKQERDRVKTRLLTQDEGMRSRSQTSSPSGTSELISTPTTTSSISTGSSGCISPPWS
jgi:hypothetical protein